MDLYRGFYIYKTLKCKKTSITFFKKARYNLKKKVFQRNIKYILYLEINLTEKHLKAFDINQPILANRITIKSIFAHTCEVSLVILH